VEINPADALGHNMIGASLVRTGKPEQAIQYFQNAIQLKDDFIDASINLASVHKRKGDVDTAIMIYRKALQKSPDDPELHNNLVSILTLPPRSLPLKMPKLTWLTLLKVFSKSIKWLSVPVTFRKWRVTGN
jgi:Tfp pilus assembly protein PilF